MFSQALPAEIFGYLIVFTRIGAIIMMLPALGETAIPPRVRLVLALSISLLIYIVVRSLLPSMPETVVGLFMVIIGEVLVGIMIGTAIRLFVAALHVAGNIIAMNTGLAVAMAFDPVQGVQSAIMGTFLTLMGTTLIFVLDLHHMMIAGMHDSYYLFPIGQAVNMSDFAQSIIDVVARSFLLGVQISAPFIVYAILFNVGLGLLARLMPQLQVFFIALPLNIIMGFVIMLLVIAAMMAWYVQALEENISLFVR